MEQKNQIYENMLQKRKLNKVVCECGSVIRKSEIAKHLQTKKHTSFFGLEYKPVDIDQIKRDHNIKYYEKNKEKILNDRKANKVICECGSVYRKNDAGDHRRTLKHQNFILENQKNFENHIIVSPEKSITDKIKCECGSEFRKFDEQKHKNTGKHKAYITRSPLQNCAKCGKNYRKMNAEDHMFDRCTR